MRIVLIVFLVGLSGMGVAKAQSLLGGPLSNSAPSVSPTAAEGPRKAAKTAHPKVSHPKTASHAKIPATDAAKAGTPERDTPVARRTTEEDPLSLGMKWNGSNDNASQTRVQNYGGEAAGTGAAVGLSCTSERARMPISRSAIMCDPTHSFLARERASSTNSLGIMMIVIVFCSAPTS